jgi:hypothetical protein
MATPPRSIALNDANAPDSFPMGVRADETMTEPGMADNLPCTPAAPSRVGVQQTSLTGW